MVGTPTATTFVDTTVAAGHAYFYRVRAVKTGSPITVSGFSVADAASIRSYVPPAVGLGIHHFQMEDARAAVNQVRAAAGLPAFSFTDPSLEGLPVKAIHITELRSAITAAMNVAGAPTPVFDEITPRVTIIRAQHIFDILNLLY